jgi:hypothetical protein
MKPAHSKTLLPVIAAAGGILSAAPANAIQLGEIEVQSRLGQPLRASIAYALGPNEQLFDFCVSLSQGIAANGMPAVRRATVSVANGVISLTGSQPIREPLLTTRIIVDCPYTAHISREYLMFIDPPGAVTQEVTPPAPVAVPVRQDAPTVRQPATAPTREPIADTARYRVQPGDTLSDIAQRIEDRPVGLWEAVDRIFTANPDAFVDGDINRLKAGSLLSIPDFGADTPLTVADIEPEPVAESSAEPEAAPVETSAAYEAGAGEPMPEPVEEAVADETEVILEPGDIILDADIEAPEITAESPNRPEARIVAPAPVEETRSPYSWMLWLGGAGLAIIVGLLLFGRRARGIFGSSPIGPEASPEPASRHGVDAYSLAKAAEEPIIDDDSPTEENLALDADLVIGTGLQGGAEVEVAEDFAFAATTALDFELPEEMASNNQPQTDIIPPLNVEESSILESEMLPEDDEYDMSVIVDATKMPRPEDVTERDLQAVVVDADDDDTLIDDSYTVSKEVDYKILEQDYQDELTATQKLNEEITRAASELADRLDAATVEDATSEISMATVTELDLTAQLSAQNDEVVDDATHEIEAYDKTVELVADDKTVEMPADDKTVEMPRAEDDDTMEIESGRVDTRAG